MASAREKIDRGVFRCSLLKGLCALMRAAGLSQVVLWLWT